MKVSLEKNGIPDAKEARERSQKNIFAYMEQLSQGMAHNMGEGLSKCRHYCDLLAKEDLAAIHESLREAGYITCTEGDYLEISWEEER